MQLFENAIRNALLQEEIKNGKIIVYHMTKADACRGGILKSGWERYYTGRNSNAYGPGIYTTLYPSMDPRSRTNQNTYHDNMFDIDMLGKGSSKLDVRRGGIYGTTMLKCVAKSLKGFIAFDKNMSRYLYGSPTYFKKHPDRYHARNYYDIDEQLQKILPKQVYDSVKDTPEFKETCYSKDRFVMAYHAARACDELCQAYPEVNHYVNGFITHSSSDGYVIIFRDFSACKPIEYSTNYGKTWHKVQLDPSFKEYNSDNVDLRRALGLDNITDYNNQTNKAVTDVNQLPRYWEYHYRNKDRITKLAKAKKPYDYLPAFMYGDFARVEKDGKYNYFYKGTLKTKKPISDVWWDSASESWSKNGWTRVSKNGMIYYLHHEGDGFDVYNTNKEYICNLNMLDPQSGKPKTDDFDVFDNDDW